MHTYAIKKAMDFSSPFYWKIEELVLEKLAEGSDTVTAAKIMGYSEQQLGEDSCISTKICLNANSYLGGRADFLLSYVLVVESVIKSQLSYGDPSEGFQDKGCSEVVFLHCLSLCNNPGTSCWTLIQVFIRADPS